MARKLFLLIITALCISAPAWGQISATLTLTLQNASSKEPIDMASIQLMDSSGKSTYYYSDQNGNLTANGLEFGEYTLNVRSMGYADLTREITIDSPKVALGVIAMNPSQMLKELVVEGTAMRTSQHGDTVSYNASAFQVSADASTESLLSKMPGIIVGIDGTVTAQGETVEKVFVDGKEFFGNDVSSAIKNLPAEVVDRIEVYNKLSDQAEFTGFDDGEGYKAINIVTQLEKRSGQFGKVYGAYGHSNKYIVGGNINIFNGSSRLSVIGLVNNLNQQNFSFEDIAGVTNSGGSSSGGGMMMGGPGRGGDARTYMVRPQDGVSTVQAVGLNFSDTWGKKEKVDFSGSYFFNHMRTINEQYRELWEITDPENIWYTESDSYSRSHNYNHRFNAKIDYKINEGNSLMIRPSFSYQKYTSYGNSFAMQELRLTDGTSSPIKQQRTDSESEREAYDTGLFAMYRTRLGKAGRTLTITMNGNYSENENLSLPSQYFYFPPYMDGQVADSTFLRRTLNDTYSYRLSAGATYTEPIGKNSQLSAEYRASYNYSDADRRTYLWDEILEKYDPDYDPTLSSIYNSGYLTHSIGPGYRLSTGKVNLSASLSYQNSRMRNEQIAPGMSDNTYSFDNVTYRAMMRFNFNPANSLNVRLSSYMRNPSASQLMEIPDMSDTENVIIGNPGLKPTYNHRLNMFYINSNVSKGTTLTLAVDSRISGDYIANSTVTNADAVIPNSGGLTLGQGNKMIQYVNMGGYWDVRGYVSYGFPVKLLRSNLNINVQAKLGETPSRMNGADTKMNERYLGGGAVLGSNISRDVDFTVRYNGSYNVTNSTASGISNKNKFVEHYATASLKWVVWKGITFTGDVSYSNYRGITNDYEESFVIVNLYVGKKIFRNQLGEISVGVNDLLDQNTAFRRTVTAQSIMNTINNTIGRYYAIQFVYNLRNFGKGKSATGFEGYDVEQGGSVGVQRGNTGGRPGGGPPMGGRGPIGPPM